ncbi:MAG: GNAT family protein [Leucobacter sp.]
MTRQIIHDHPAISQYVAAKVGLPVEQFGLHTCLGLVDDDRILAGAVYCDYSGTNVFVHLAGEGRRWLNREFLYVGFQYPFEQMRVRRLTGWVEESNLDARRFDEHIGFREEARLKGAARDGGDVILYVMWKEDCRWLRRGRTNGTEQKAA